MAEVAKQARRRTKRTSDEAKSKATDEARDVAESDGRGDGEARESQAGQGATITSELKDAFREAAIEVLKPVMRKATMSAAKYAVTQGPDLVKDKVAPKIKDAGGAGALAKGVASKGGGVAGMVGGVASTIGDKLPGGGKKGESPSGTGRGRRLPVQEFIDVGVDLQTAYDQYTQFEDWPKFAHRVERIEQRDDTTLMWHENIWGVRRSWEAEITDQTPCERIAWRSTSGPKTIGVVTFHRLSDQLTRIAVTMDFQPKGLFEKTSSGTRISRRALKSDLMRFKAFIELRDEATGAWRGEIEEGEVVDEQRDEEPREQDDATEAGAAEDDYEEYEEEEPEEPTASEEEEEEEYAEDEEEEYEEPADEAEEDEEPAAEEDEEPMAEEDEEPAAEEDEEEPEATRRRQGNGRFKRDADEEEAAPRSRPRRRRKAAPAVRAKG